ncbi:ATP-binding cassette domain-containing protein [Desulfovibrio ferrophilus]|uniref:Iron ABC transporter ATPase n=1 Tax=Desulfovibrio ferrophilus TaxID=241368 RepID=A0A2Z6AXT8_9BACT|nr:ATP-binding cassette domain-containing protein [Desulfovibrio ferrophilus]BBD08028.1 iron ABC transporter ATPase [Desulfovibrio ferrophilus]
MTTPLFELQKITYAYPCRKPVLDELDFCFEQGANIGLIGPNGSGKTTLAHIVMGLINPNSGTILHRGHPISDEKGFATLRKEVGLLFQNADDQLFYPTVLEDVAFGPLNLGKSPAEAAEIAHTTLRHLGLEGFEERITYKLSGGEKKLVSLATVLAMEPKAVFLDEPTNALDVDTRHRLIHILNELALPRIIISHDYDFLAQTTKDIYAMKDGKIRFDGHTATHEHVHAHTHDHQNGHNHAQAHSHESGHSHGHAHTHSHRHEHLHGDVPHTHGD